VIVSDRQLAPGAELPHDEAMRKSVALLVFLALIPLGWGAYDWLANDNPNNGIFIIPMAIVGIRMLFLLPAKDPDDPPKAP
jgi:hypothetical protein